MDPNDGMDHEKPVHRVTLSDFYIGKYQVTNIEWHAIMSNNPSKFKFDYEPVTDVSWDDCQEFIKKLNVKTGLKYCLPTEAEWEYAARGGNQSKGYEYSGSDCIDDVAWYIGNSGEIPHYVGKKYANELGIHDMSGNVSEWCSDWSDNYSSADQTNPQGAPSGTIRVVRGGSYDDPGNCCGVAARLGGHPDYRSNTTGFRLARSY